MVDARPAAPAPPRPVLVTLPGEIDLSNADEVATRLAAACGPGAPVVIADMTGTTFCDSLAIRVLLLACRRAAATGTELRLLLHNPGVLQVMKWLGVDTVLPIYHSLAQALAPDSGAAATERAEPAATRPTGAARDRSA